VLALYENSLRKNPIFASSNFVPDSLATSNIAGLFSSEMEARKPIGVVEDL